MGTPTTADEPDLLWSPPDDAWEATQIGAFARAAADRHGVDVGDYAALWHWSVDDLDAFWQLVVDHFEIRFHARPSRVRSGGAMPGVSWFPDATLNYAEHALRHDDDEQIAIVGRSQTRDLEQWTYGELRDAVARAAAGLRRLGVERGDRVAAYLPNIGETVVAFLATASIGAIWSSCAPEFGVTSVIDRLEQIAPKVLITVDGYRYGGRAIDRTEEVTAIREALPGLEHTVLLAYLDTDADLPDATAWEDLVAEPAEPTFDPVPFGHPLYILFSSGTTGIPKAIVHSHGGITVEHHKMLGLHHDLGPGDAFFWFTTTGWMMWNFLVSGLLVGSTVVLFDGDPGHPDLGELWRLAADTQITMFGVSAPFLMACRKQDMTPGDDVDLTHLAQIGSTGAPLPPEGFSWVYDHVKADVLLASVSGGTDMCTAFVGASPVTPVWSGEISCRCLGARVEAFDEHGEAVLGERGELVITSPMPSMPVGFWDDDDGSRYRDAYFDTYPGIWRHGDWIRVTDRGSCVITGRSDATLNRGGVRMGTSEFYRVVEDLDEVTNALVIHLEDDTGGAGTLLLFVVLAEGHELDDLRRTILGHIRRRLSPRHVPDELHAVPDVPRTLSGKKLEVPVKKLFAGADLSDVASEGALANPESLDAYRDLAREMAHR
jgi:acetoacetyl-CoA synthetase